ncbi:MAG: phosphoribosylformylglycinamidine synthase [Gammaproteobacteria bacterium]
MSIHSFYGGPVFSDFRQQKILLKLQASFPFVQGFTAIYQYILKVERPFSPLEEARISELLQTQPRPVFHISHHLEKYPLGFEMLVIPRMGTISPWSSKATDILHNCGLSAVQRAERSVLYRVEFQADLDKQAFLKANNFEKLKKALGHMLYDPMTESLLWDLQHLETLFHTEAPQPLRTIDVLTQGKYALEQANKTLGLALNAAEIDYFFSYFEKAQRNPTDVELMMFAQANSEHCRHKIFNSAWEIDGKSMPHSLFGMIQNTYQQNPKDVLSAYKDNGAVLANTKADRLMIDPVERVYRYSSEPMPIVIKVETHNHPTAISPFPGAATGSGGEIRDEGAVGQGARPKAGLTGFSVSNLNIPDFQQPWEMHYGKPAHIASAFDIMLEAPIGAASFNNEFGRPGICGYFRTYEEHMKNSHGAVRGYHKPIMLAGGLGNIRASQIAKQTLPVGALVIQIGGPAMLIGMGGGAASSATSGSRQAEMDFASVQRSNPELQRRCQEVIEACTALGKQNPILSIHDVGAGGLSNAVPEILEGSDRGGEIALRSILNAEPGLSPMQIWCNEAQERYVLAIDPQDLATFESIAQRERCPFAVIGTVSKDQQLVVNDAALPQQPIDLPLSFLLGKTPRPLRQVQTDFIEPSLFDLAEIDLAEAAKRVLQLPCVSDKSFLITIGDRTVGGMVARDQMVGPWQVPVADVAVTANSFEGYHGEAMAVGERAPIALIHHAASALMAVGEAITNIAAAYIGKISDIKLSANWMAAAGYPGEDAGLYQAVQAVGLELCPALGIAIPVGKDSLSMRTVWQENGEERSVTAPLSLVVSAFAPVRDIRKTLTPQLKNSKSTQLILLDLGAGCHALGGSALAQVYRQQGHMPPDVDDPEMLKQFFAAIQTLNQKGLLLAYHDRSDGGLLVTLCEMAFASHCGLNIQLDTLTAQHSPLEVLFSEELGAVIQVREAHCEKVLAVLNQYDRLVGHCHVIGRPDFEADELRFYDQHQCILQAPRVQWQRLWSETSYRMQAARDNPDCAQAAYDQLLDTQDPGLNVTLTFDHEHDVAAPYIMSGVRPKIAILREQGTNSQYELAAAFDRAGFTAVDVHMTDILEKSFGLTEFVGLAAGGGFSYGDVLGAGRGWAKSILYHARAREAFAAFFARPETFTLGICNGCQMLAQLQEIIPGSDNWPQFVKNRSEQFEARLSLVEIQPSPSLFFTGMVGSRLCMASSHGEGRAAFNDPEQAEHLIKSGMAPVRYVNHYGDITEQYPANPSGSTSGIAAVTSTDGRVTLIMPHPERVFRTVLNAWHPEEWGEDGPTLRMFRNAREWVG